MQKETGKTEKHDNTREYKTGGEIALQKQLERERLTNKNLKKVILAVSTAIAVAALLVFTNTGPIQMPGRRNAPYNETAAEKIHLTTETGTATVETEGLTIRWSLEDGEILLHNKISFFVDGRAIDPDNIRLVHENGTTRVEMHTRRL